VYLAQDTRLDRTVALKILPVEMASDPERMRRFVQEAKAASALSHPNVAHIYEIGEANGTNFIAMEYVEGQTLDAKLKGRALETAEIIDIATQVADALDEAHSKGITHRDIKPSNVMITARSQAKVLDFGLAKVAAHQPQPTENDTPTVRNTDPGVVMGPVQYMSPEQALGRK
jgi:eukaryotic-like serine/threonine-protein kinase